MLITEIKPAGDSVQMVAVKYAPEVYSDDDGVAPVSFYSSWPVLGFCGNASSTKCLARISLLMILGISMVLMMSSHGQNSPLVRSKANIRLIRLDGFLI